MFVEFVVVSRSLQQGGPSEDAVSIVSQCGDCRFFAVVVDGHGREVDHNNNRRFKSPTIARFAQEIAGKLSRRFQDNPDPRRMRDYFDGVAQSVDADYRPFYPDEQRFPGVVNIGAVVSCLAVTDSHLCLAQTGDCRLYVSSSETNSGWRLLSNDHNGSNPAEFDRLQPLLLSGQFVLIEPSNSSGLPLLASAGPTRLYSLLGSGTTLGLVPTRSFGDWAYQPAVIHEPECAAFELSMFQPGELFALCSDGGNDFVEDALRNFRGYSRSVRLIDLEAWVSSILYTATDDVTIVFFRVIPE